MLHRIRRLARPLAIAALGVLAGCARVHGPGGSAPSPPAAAHAADVPIEAPAQPSAAFALARAEGADPRPELASEDAGAALPTITFREPVPDALEKGALAIANADLDAGGCRAELKRRNLPVSPVKTAQRGVGAPLRVDGPMNGVRLVVPPDSTKFGVLDCRLALTLDDLTRTLHGLGVVRVSIDNMYRPNAHLPGKKKASQHALGLAIDVTSFQLADGRVLSTEAWGASIGDVPCGPQAVMTSPSAESIEVRNLVCSLARAGLFHTVLTPSYDAAHQSHFHFDIKADTKRLSVR